MDFGLSEEQTLFQDTLNSFLTDQVGLERVRRIAGGEEPTSAVWAELAELGVSALLVPEEHGGVGLKPLDAAIAAECLGYHATPSPFLGSAVMGPTALLLAGGQGERLERLAAGELRIGVALGEAIAARAEAGVVRRLAAKLNGKALYVLDYGADEYLVADSNRGLHLVAASDLEHQPLSTVEKTRPTGELVLKDTPAIHLKRRSRPFSGSARRRARDAGGGHLGRGAEHARPGRRLRPGARAVQSPHRLLPSRQAHVRGNGRPPGALAGRWSGTPATP